MTEAVVIIALMLFLFVGTASVANRIPKTGRCFDAAGEKISATITNRNRTAEKAVTMRAKDAAGRRYKVKLKASEAKLWIKGDSVNIILSEKSKKYRILFHEYFKENEERIREHALEKLEKTIRTNFIATRLVEYKKENTAAFGASKADSQTIFAFATYMRMIDIYSVMGAIGAVWLFFWYVTTKPKFMELLVPLAIVVIIFVVINGAMKTCKSVVKKYLK